MKQRLQKILAQAGVASRRTAEEYIRQGKVSVDGRVVTEMGCQVDPDQQRILFEGRPLADPDQEKVYILLNKPKGYVTTLKDPQGRPIVTSLLPNMRTRVFPVGRLDLDTEGALLLTNDGDMAQRIQHPSYEVTKTYVATVAGQPPRKKIQQLEQGIDLEGHRTWPARLKVLRSSPTSSDIQITIHEGKKRQVRKMFAAIGHRVLNLRRIAYGSLKLGTLPTGKYRILNSQELRQIFSKKNTLYNSRRSGLE